jgi:hypothetical protein
MRKTLFLALALLGITNVKADTLPRPVASYDATATYDIGNNHSTALLNVAGPKIRATVNLANGPLTVLIDRTMNAVYTIIPSLGVTTQIPPTMMGGYSLNALNTIQLTPEAPDTVNGVDAMRYAVDTQVKPGDRFTGHVWATQDGAVLAIDGTATNGANATPVSIVLSNFMRRPQNPMLFATRPGNPAAAPWVGALLNTYNKQPH